MPGIKKIAPANSADITYHGTNQGYPLTSSPDHQRAPSGPAASLLRLARILLAELFVSRLSYLSFAAIASFVTPSTSNTFRLLALPATIRTERFETPSALTGPTTFF
jgi:hypothetical protein